MRANTVPPPSAVDAEDVATAAASSASAVRRRKSPTSVAWRAIACRSMNARALRNRSRSAFSTALVGAMLPRMWAPLRTLGMVALLVGGCTAPNPDFESPDGGHDLRRSVADLSGPPVPVDLAIPHPPD